MKLGHFHKSGSHRFEADPSAADYLIESDKAKKLMRARKLGEALGIYLALADDDTATPQQESLALERAVNWASGIEEW